MIYSNTHDSVEVALGHNVWHLFLWDQREINVSNCLQWNVFDFEDVTVLQVLDRQSLGNYIWPKPNKDISVESLKVFVYISVVFFVCGVGTKHIV
jgi:predicted phosphatase